MNNLGLIIYLISVVDTLIGILQTSAAIFGLVLIGVSIAYGSGFENPESKNSKIISNTLLKWIKRSAIIMSISIIMLVFIPSSKIMTAMIFVPKIVNNQKIQDIGNNGLELINEKLKEWTKEITKKDGK